MKRLFFVFWAGVALTACDKEGEGTSPKSITIPNQQQLTQTFFADDNVGNSGVTFTTTGAWTSEIKESATTKTTRAAADWLSISPSSGDKAGDYTISLSLLTNYTGERRSATISLKCSGEVVDIVIAQEAVTATGDQPKPNPEPSGSGLLKNETTGQSVKLVAMQHEIETPERVRVKFVGEGENVGEYLADFYNPLKDGKLKSGAYTIKLRNTYPQPEMLNGDCEWYKSDLGNYGTSGTIKVELNNDTYTFTFDIGIGSTKLTGSFIGVPEYINGEIKVESISLNQTSKTLEMGEEFTLKATILPENATDNRYTWSSSNPAVATVSEEGVVKSVSAGATTITATSTEGAKTATCQVTVKALPTTGNGTFSNNKGQSIAIARAVQWVNEKEPKEVAIRFAKPNSASDNLAFTLVRAGNDTGTLKAGTYTVVRYLQSDELGVKYSYENEGSATVILGGGSYTVTLNITTEEGIKISGTYTGAVPAL